MRAAFFNPDRAVEYLLNGIPENVQAEQRQGGGGGATAAAANPTPAAPATGATAAPAAEGEGGDQPINLFEAAAQAGRGGSGARSGRAGGSGTAAGAGAGANLGALGAGIGAAAGTQGGEGLGNLDFLRTNPQFQQLRQIVQTQPRMLEPILQQVGAGNPQLATLIGQNPDQFLQLLSEDAEGDAPLPPGAQEISVTEDEREAIERVSPYSLIASTAKSKPDSTGCSCVVWASSGISSSKPTSPATRMRSWPQTSYSTSRMMGRKGAPSEPGGFNKLL